MWFKGNESLNFKTDKPKSKVYDKIEFNLGFIGKVDISDDGQIIVNVSSFNGFGFRSEMKGLLREKEGKYLIELEWHCKRQNWLTDSYVSRFLANKKIQKKVEEAFENLRFEFR